MLMMSDTSGTGRLVLVLRVLLVFNAAGNWHLMLMMRTVWFDTSGTGRLNLVLVVLLVLQGTKDMAGDAHNATRSGFDTSGTGRLILVLVVLLVLQGTREMAANANDPHGLV